MPISKRKQHLEDARKRRHELTQVSFIKLSDIISNNY